MVKTLPRFLDEYVYDVSERYRKKWDFEDSIFKDFKDAEISQCVRFDLDNSKIFSMVKKPE